MKEEDIANETLDDMGIANVDDVEKRLNEPEMTPSKTKSYLKEMLKDAKFKKNQLKGYQAQVKKQLRSGVIPEAESKRIGKEYRMQMLL